MTSDAGGNAAWSPDGKKIAYCSSADGDSEIWIVNLDGSGMKQLTKNKGNDTNPAFSPDGSYIFYLSDQNGTAWALRVMRPDGSDIKTLRKVGTAPRWQFARMWAGGGIIRITVSLEQADLLPGRSRDAERLR